MFDRERLRRLHNSAPVCVRSEHLLLNDEARSFVSVCICTTVFFDKGGHGRLVRGPHGLFAPPGLATAGGVRPARNDIDDSGFVVERPLIRARQWFNAIAINKLPLPIEFNRAMLP
jgi:hypothetical protein